MDIAGHIQISTQKFRKRFKTPCTVPSNLEEASKDVTHELVLQESLEDYSNYPIYRDLRMEAKNYALLQKLQGSSIPKLYNLVEGPVLFSHRKVNAVFVCIVLQDCGDRINTFDEDQDFRLRTSEKLEVLNRLLQIHSEGYAHGNFHLYDIVGTIGNYKIIDLKYMREHTCQWVEGRDEWNPRELPPNRLGFPCRYLYRAAELLHLWKDPYITILRHQYFGDDMNQLPPQEIVNCLIPKLAQETEENALALLDWIKEFKIEMDANPNCNIQQLVEKYQANPISLPDAYLEEIDSFKKYVPYPSDEEGEELEVQ
ncbi:hypothetical protein PNOK_0475900 [Pyrrhoderma noxium]|uniref:Protein kinase domain-containing protein n=1 Tax=Pyrrhoderma noxium TaxID=2282107 RepID=A0A286UK26_9AGAM|nr:hypothetical protein PNOK_0475900 [Pyrrhoderma noxium]